MKKFMTPLLLVLATYLTGCASVPMASLDEDQARKQFAPPPADQAGLYVYRNSHLGAALKKTVYLDQQPIGETAAMTYLYRQVPAGSHRLSTESEFSNNELQLELEGGRNYYVNQYIKLGVMVGGANLELMSEAEGQAGVLECKLAK